MRQMDRPRSETSNWARSVYVQAASIPPWNVGSRRSHLSKLSAKVAERQWQLIRGSHTSSVLRVARYILQSAAVTKRSPTDVPSAADLRCRLSRMRGEIPSGFAADAAGTSEAKETQVSR